MKTFVLSIVAIAFISNTLGLIFPEFANIIFWAGGLIGGLLIGRLDIQ